MPTIKPIRVTPAVARQWIEHNDGNRNIRKSRVAKYADDMAAGRWQQNGDTFKFDTDGRMIDGQHRCFAIIESGATIDSFVVHGLPASAAQTLDAGAPRSASDALFYAGELHNHAKDIAAGLNAWTSWTEGRFTHARSTASAAAAKLSNAAMVEAWRDNPTVVSASVEAKAIYQRGLRLPVGALAVALVELRALDFEAANDFFDRIVELRTSGKGDPIHTLITRIQDEMGPGRRMLPATALFMLFRTWNAFVNGERLLKMQFGSSESGWTPMPKPSKVPPAFWRGSQMTVVA